MYNFNSQLIDNDNKQEIEQMSTSQIIHHSIIKNSKPSLINSPSPNQFSKSSTKRIYQSVFRIIDFEEPESLQFNHQNTNGTKIHSFVNDENILSHLYDKMKIQGNLDYYPILKICCEEISCYPSNQNLPFTYNRLYELDLHDIIEVFSRFGDLNKIIFTLDSKFAYVFFNTFHTAYIARKLLHRVIFPGKMAKLYVEWVNNVDYELLIPHFGTYLNSIDWSITYKYCSNKLDTNNTRTPIVAQKQNKLTCRYEIQIQNQKDFQVARRIIGSKGCHMKKIIQESLQFAKSTQFYKKYPKNFENINQLLKLRLRGKGSGYKEGPQQQESQQSLHLCVSAKEEICFQFACEKVQKLLQNVYDQYYEYTLQQGKPLKFYINKNSLLTSGNNANPIQYDSEIKQNIIINSNQSNELNSFDIQSVRITPNRICELLELRNKARRQLNFLQADRIRNFLRNCGVCLIDQKGRRGRATQVTTWKYVC